MFSQRSATDSSGHGFCASFSSQIMDYMEQYNGGKEIEELSQQLIRPRRVI